MPARNCHMSFERRFGKPIRRGRFLFIVFLLLPVGPDYYARPIQAGRNTIASHTPEAEKGRDAETAESNDPSAEQSFNEAEQLRGEWNEHSLRLAIESYKAALARWRAEGDGRRAAHAAKNIGEIYSLLGQT